MKKLQAALMDCSSWNSTIASTTRDAAQAGDFEAVGRVMRQAEDACRQASQQLHAQSGRLPHAAEAADAIDEVTSGLGAMADATDIARSNPQAAVERLNDGMARYRTGAQDVQRVSEAFRQ